MALSPFVPVKLPCPVCGVETTNRYIKAKLFVITRTDLDGRPIDVHWLNPAYQGIRPHDYSIWFCGACGYADFHQAFRRPEARGKRFDFVKDKILAASKSPENPLKALAERITIPGPEGIPPATALNMTLLAIAGQRMPSRVQRDPDKLGQLYLRATWYFKDWQTGAIQVDPEAQRFFESLKARGLDVPLNADESVKHAVEHYSAALAGTAPGSDPRRELKTLGLLAQLHRVVNNFDEALRCTRQLFDRARARKLELTARLDSGRVGAEEAEHLRNELEWMGNASGEARSIREAVNETIIESEMAALRAWLEAQGATELTPELRARALAEKIAHDITLRRFAGEQEDADEDAGPPPTAQVARAFSTESYGEPTVVRTGKPWLRILKEVLFGSPDPGPPAGNVPHP